MVIRQLFLTCLFLISLLSTAVGQGDPQSSLTSFKGRPFALFFFDDSESAIYFDSDTGLVHVSQDEGKTWSEAKEIPQGQAVLVIPHPFNNRVAFVLTSGTTHYRTTDRGKNWSRFDLPVSPAFVARPLSFHSDELGYIIYQGRRCTSNPIGWSDICVDEAYYTKDAFADNPELLLADITQCQFAHSSQEWKHDAHKDLVYCVGYDSSGMHSPESSRLFSSIDYFKSQKLEDLGIGKNAKGVVAFAVVSKFAVVALRDLSKEGDMLLYVTVDTQTWARAKFPHASSAQLRENAYTILESTTHSLAVDVVLHDSNGGAIGTLFVSNSNGTYFTPSLADTNRNDYGYVDFERVYGVDGVGLVNIVANAQEVEGRGSFKQLRTRITFNDGRTWSPLEPPPSEGNCDKTNEESCSLQLWSVTSPHNFGRVFSSPAPGLLMGVGAVASSLPSYRSSKTFLSTDAGVTWTMIKGAPYKYEFGDSGSIIVIVPDNDDQAVDFVEYSLDFGKSWKSYSFGQPLSPKALLTVPDSTSQKFLLLGEVAKKDQKSGVGEWVIVQLDFANTRKRKCEGLENSDKDFEKWNARPRGSECLLGRKQWYTRRKTDVDCYVGSKFIDPIPHSDFCECTIEDYECDFNYVRSGTNCIEMGLEPIPANVCLPGGNGKYFGSSGWRKIPGDSCYGGLAKDEKVEKDCSKASPPEGQIVHQTFQFPGTIQQHGYFRQSKTILVRLADGRLFQSSNEGYSWQEPVPDERFAFFVHHPHAHDRAYLVTQTTRFYATTDSGRSWNPYAAPIPPNTFRSQTLRFQPQSERLIWVGNKNCESGLGSQDCHAEAYYSRNNGRDWDHVESYVVNCAWAVDTKLSADPTEIICESYREKKGNQQFFNQGNNALELVEGKGYYKNKKKLFPHVVGFAKFSEYLVVAELREDQGNTLQLQVSLDGVKFAQGQFPPAYDPHTHAYTVLESSTDSLFLHMTTSEAPYPYWGHLLKSNSNGTYFNVILENVNRNNYGFVDFEKVIGLDGIALVNVVSNPQQASMTGVKELQSRITHNDGGSWKYLQSPEIDSLGNPYECDNIRCHLNIHGYTERTDPRATYSSPSTIGVLIAVGNVGETLAPYDTSDTFLSRDAGFTWTEVRKDAHLWEFGDFGSLLVLVNDEKPTDRILYSTDEGLRWREYQFTSPGEDKVRVQAIVTVYEDNSRKFILFGNYPGSRASVAIHVDFSALVNRKCIFKVDDPTNDDFEKWSPSSEREETCLFGKQTIYYRRAREANCVVGERPNVEPEVTICSCSEVDFECEFNHVRDDNDVCVLASGTTPLPDDETCPNDGEYWYSRTAYRKIPISQCEGGKRLDRGAQYPCPGLKHHSGWFWFFVIIIPFAFTALVASWYYRKSGMTRGTIRLPGDGSRYYSDGGIVDTLASVPWFLIGIAGIAWEWVTSRIEGLQLGRTTRGYRDLPVDEDAQILRFEDEE